MAKRLKLIVASLAVLAGVAPSSASAFLGITDPPGKLVLPGTLLQGTTSNFLIETSLGKITCTTASITGEVTANSGSTVRGIGLGEGSGTNCNIAVTHPMPVTGITIKEAHAATIGSGTFNWTLNAHLISPKLTCHFESVSMPFTYASGGDTLKFTKGDFKATPAACEPGLFSAEFTMETDGGGSVVLD